MKKSLVTLFTLAAFCWSTFAIEFPRQDTTRRKQDTTKRHQPKKSDTAKKKMTPKNKSKKDTLNRKPGDTSLRRNQPM